MYLYLMQSDKFAQISRFRFIKKKKKKNLAGSAVCVCVCVFGGVVGLGGVYIPLVNT